ncbi:hypothetical protein GUJ93_ZPchr0006g44217 [Zizania palustris]|uniref:Uncharacterized protein n=1 Tax=Zizania palustris TaxID=103762 RepID=A0A8J5ST37_ZIZPA|nr:hypothetical protein GUJ93_ZPchr0006g44217 [Zizania palustris]
MAAGRRPLRVGPSAAHARRRGSSRKCVALRLRPCSEGRRRQEALTSRFVSGPRFISSFFRLLSLLFLPLPRHGLLPWPPHPVPAPSPPPATGGGRRYPTSRGGPAVTR